MTELAVVGHPVKRIDALEKVLGATRYAGDLSFHGMLHARTLLCPHPHARVLKIDTSRAEALDGVEAVVTAKSIKGSNRHGLIVPDQPVLVPEGGKALMVGDPIALVAARSEAIAAEALELIKVEYQPLEVVADVAKAAQPSAACLHEDKESNLCVQNELKKGDVEGALLQAEVIIENTFLTPRQEHGYLEPEAGVATIDIKGEITIFAGSQNPVHARTSISRALGIPESKVRVVTTMTGGGFGGKDEPTIHLHLALLASITKRPVRLVWTREESMLIHPKRGPVQIRYKMGATREGKIIASDVEIVSDAGAYATHTPGVLRSMIGSVSGPYNIPNVKVEARGYYTNNPPSGAMRGYGMPPPSTALEAQIDILARQLGMDPVELRLKNALRKGDNALRPGVPMEKEVTLPLCLKEALAAAGPLPPPSSPTKKVGRGISAAMPMFDISAAPFLNMKGTGAIVELFPDGTATVRTGACEIGMGIATALAQIAAEVLGIRFEDVSVIWGDTGATPKAGPSVASRSSYTSGNAVKIAAETVRARVLEKAADMLEASPEMLTIKDRRIFVAEAPHRGLPLSQVTTACYDGGVDLLGESWFIPTHATFGHTFMSMVADVEVDEDTGEVGVLRLVAAHDTGQALNPVSVRGQLLGGAIQSMGWSLVEDMPTRNAVIMTPSFTEYLVPTILDIPKDFQAIIIQDPYPTGPFGAKGVGEHTMASAAGAVLNAIYDAVGARILEFPATPQKVLASLKVKNTR